MIQPDYPFDRQGVITAGEYVGWTVRLLDDSNGQTGGYYIVISEPKGGSGNSYDSWLENKDDIYQYFNEMEWTVEW